MFLCNSHKMKERDLLDTLLLLSNFVGHTSVRYDPLSFLYQSSNKRKAYVNLLLLIIMQIYYFWTVYEYLEETVATRGSVATMVIVIDCALCMWKCCITVLNGLVESKRIQKLLNSLKEAMSEFWSSQTDAQYKKM